jgi:hypothetical protein
MATDDDTLQFLKRTVDVRETLFRLAPYLRYAVLPETRRLLIDDHGTISIYDSGLTNFRRRPGQGRHRTISFTSQDGLVASCTPAGSKQLTRPASLRRIRRATCSELRRDPEPGGHSVIG